MAHMIDRMMYAGEEPWHGLGRRLPETCDSETLRNLVFDWHAQERAVSYQGADGDEPADDYKALVRSDNGKLLCVAPKTYGVVQYADALALLDAASASGVTKYITAATLDEGRRAFALAAIPSATFDVAGSEVKPYLLLSTSHDASLALRVHFTGVYVVCNNTLTAALGGAGVSVGGRAQTRHIPNVIMLKHTSKVSDRLAIVTRLVEQATSYFGAFHERALQLVNQRYATSEMRDLARVLFPISDKQEADRRQYGVESASHKAQATVVRLFDGAQRAAAPAPGTRWAAFNAVTEFVDHHARRTGATPAALAEHRFDATIFGAGAKVRQTALDLLLAA